MATQEGFAGGSLNFADTNRATKGAALSQRCRQSALVQWTESPLSFSIEMTSKYGQIYL
jgi:hypothetical protein